MFTLVAEPAGGLREKKMLLVGLSDEEDVLRACLYYVVRLEAKQGVALLENS